MAGTHIVKTAITVTAALPSYAKPSCTTVAERNNKFPVVLQIILQSRC